MALEACPAGSKNCIRTAWTPPKGTSKGDAAKTVKSVLASYPQEGQAGVDKGGWTWIKDNLSGSGAGSLEFKSGIGMFAKLANGGKPFIDDVALLIEKDGVVQVRSSSRIGQSDLGVNQKRLKFLAAKFKALGWQAPEPKY